MEPIYLSLQLEVKPLCIQIRALPSPQPKAGSSRSSGFDSGSRVLSPSRVQNSLSSTTMSPTELRTTRASTSKCRVIRPLPPLPSSSPLYRSPLTPSRSPRPLPTPPSSSPIRTLQPSTKNTSLPSILETVALDVRSLPGSETLAPVLVPPCSPEEVLVQPPLLPTTDQNDLDSFPFLPNPHSDCRITLCELLSDDSAREPPPFLQNPHMDYGRLTDENDFWEPPLILTTPSGKKSHPLDGFDTTAYLSAAMTVKKIVDLSPPEDNCDEKEGDEKSLKGRLSRHWVREKRGERREVHDFQTILSSLRSL